MEDTVFYERLMGLNPLIGKTATQTQEDEYVWLLYEHGNLDKKFYVDYINNERREDILKTCHTIGGIVLAGWLLTELFDNK